MQAHALLSRPATPSATTATGAGAGVGVVEDKTSVSDLDQLSIQYASYAQVLANQGMLDVEP